jgi:excinuclease ABC subunit C
VSAKRKSPLTSLRKRISKVPPKPGIYRWLNAEGHILYVGKANNLKVRLRSYLQEKRDKNIGPWKIALRNAIADFDYTITSNELEALILETNLIKEYKPKYNVLMKDDKNYVYVRISMQDPYPSVSILRQMEEDRAKYFGPFLSSRDTRHALELLHDVFQYHACQRSIETLNRGKDASLKPCIEYQIGRCNGLCTGKISQEEYRKRMEEVVRFFRGDRSHVAERLTSLMHEAAAAKKFERAGKLRDTLTYLASLDEQQIVSGTSGENTDALGVALLKGKTQVVILQERNGKVVGERSLVLSGGAESMASVLTQFLPQYYAGEACIPNVILCSEEPEDRTLLEEWFRTRGKRTEIHVPERGKKSKLLLMAEENALEKVNLQLAKWEAEEVKVEQALSELQRILELPSKPKRIECYDISHLGGTETVGSMSVCIDGKARNDQYRSFTIRTMRKGDIDDYKALKEVLLRRLRHLTEGTKEWLKQIPIALEKKGKRYVTVHPALEGTYAERGFRYVRIIPKELKKKVDDESIVMVLEKKEKPDPSLTTKPDLLVLDGGKGQLSVGREALASVKLDIPLISLAKQEEEVFIPGRSHALPFPKDSEGKFLLMRLRDEAHRFANRHREKRLKKAMIS